MPEGWSVGFGLHLAVSAGTMFEWPFQSNSRGLVLKSFNEATFLSNKGAEINIGALIITYTVLGVPYSKSSTLGRKTLV